MIPGEYQVVACPHCQGLAKYMTLTSGNTIGARLWSDGKEEAPMLPRPPAVVRCRHCAECYWLADAEKVGSLDPWNDEERPANPVWDAAQEVEAPTEEEYYRALRKNLAKDRQQERNLRVLAWWRRNDAFRDDSEAGAMAPMPSPCRENLEALAGLLQEDDENDCIMRAEVFRELGEFDSARQILSRLTSSECAEVVRQLAALCDRGDACVRELHLDEPLLA